jgi:hypothetical protein
MATNFISPQTLRSPRGLPLLVPILAFPLAILLFLTLAIDRGADFLTFGILGISFVALATTFLLSNGSIGAQWYTAPGFMTILAVLEFFVTPFSLILSAYDQVDKYYITAMVFLLLGFSAFWLTCWFFRRPSSLVFAPQRGTYDHRILVTTVLLFLIGASAKLILWKLGFIGYEVATARYSADVSAVGAMSTCSQALTMAMIISGIEVIGKRSRVFVFRAIFVASLVLLFAFGIISAMKAELIMPVFSVSILMGIVQRRLPKFLWITPLLFPPLQIFMSAYRANLNSGYASQINTADGLVTVLRKSTEDVLSGGSAVARRQKTSFQLAGDRLNDLALFRNVLQLPSPDLLNGDETIWMAPFYPFIPRVLWRNKPIFNKAQRMTEALGYGTISATNVPGIADLYALGGTIGVVIGMAIWGACLQLYMNRMSQGLSEKGLFIYILILFTITTIERDIIAMIGGAVESSCILLVLAKVVYGGRFFSLRSAAPRAKLARSWRHDLAQSGPGD